MDDVQMPVSDREVLQCSGTDLTVGEESAGLVPPAR